MGLVETTSPQPGDVAVVETGNETPSLAICTPSGFASKGFHGIAVWQFKAVVAWEV